MKHKMLHVQLILVRITVYYLTSRGAAADACGLPLSNDRWQYVSVVQSVDWRSFGFEFSPIKNQHFATFVAHLPKESLKRALINHFEALLTKFLRLNVGKINSSSSIWFQFQPLEVWILSQSGCFLESNEHLKTTLKRFWPNFFNRMMATLILHPRFDSNFNLSKFEFCLKVAVFSKAMST